MSLFDPQSFSKLIKDRDNNHLDAEKILARSRARISECESEIKAFAHLSGGQTHTQSDGALANGTLAGIAVGIKDIFDTHDMPTSYGSEIYKNHQPRADAAIVAMLRKKGACIIGKTKTTEFAFLNPTDTRNPNNLDHNPGGSSSGSAAAVAAGMVSVAIGTQTGGSIIRPAAYCGIAGYKPSYRLIQTVGIKYFAQSLDTVGLFAKSIADVAHFTSLATDRDLTIKEINPEQITIGLYQSDILDLAEPEMTKALATTAQILENFGFNIVKIDEPNELKTAHEIHPIIQNYEAAQACASDLLLHEEELSDILAQTLKLGADISSQDYDSSRRSAKSARKRSQSVFSQVDVLLTPSATGAAPKGFQSTGNPVFNRLWTLLGTPVVNIPGLYNDNQMPMGIQAIGRFGNDKTLLSIAHKIEEAISQKH